MIMSFSAIFSVSNKAYAFTDKVDGHCKPKYNFLFWFPPWYKYLEVGTKNCPVNTGSTTVVTDPCGIKGPADASGGLDWGQALPRIGLAIVEILLRIAGMVAVGFVIFGGFKYMTSQGEPENLKKAQSAIINALVGLAIAMLSTLIVGVIGSQLWG